jgi:hypothetical protein
MISPSARTSTQLVLPPYRTVPGPGVGIEPRTPQKITLVLEAFTLLIEDCIDCDTQILSDQEFSHGSIHGSLLAVISKPHRGYWALLAEVWIWAIWSCAECWRGNPNYSYGWIVPVLSLTDAARRLTLVQSENIARPILAVPISVIVPRRRRARYHRNDSDG